jgi:hypothetical protein
MPCAITSRRISAIENRDSGKPKRYGSSQARAFTWTTTLGGKAGQPPAARLFFKTWYPLQAKPFPPFAHDLPRDIEA